MIKKDLWFKEIGVQVKSLATGPGILAGDPLSSRQPLETETSSYAQPQDNTKSKENWKMLSRSLRQRLETQVEP